MVEVPHRVAHQFDPGLAATPIEGGILRHAGDDLFRQLDRRAGALVVDENSELSCLDDHEELVGLSRTARGGIPISSPPVQ